MQSHLLFVYGTLKQGHGNHRCLYSPSGLGSKFVASTRTSEEKWELIPNGSSYGGFPFLIEGNQKVYGEVYAIDDEVFRQCDSLEGYPNFYNRRIIQLEDGLSAWAYIPNDSLGLRNRVDQQRQRVPDAFTHGVEVLPDGALIWAPGRER